MNDKPMTIDDTLYNYVFSGLSLEKINKIPKWLLDNLDNNKPLIEKLMAAERLKELDKVIELQGKQFNRWTQMDIANFFDAIGRRYRELTHQANGETA